MDYEKLKNSISLIHLQREHNLLRADLYCYYFLKDFFNRYEIEKVDIDMRIYHNQSNYGGDKDKMKKNYDFRFYTFDPAKNDKKHLYVVQDGQASFTHENSYGGPKKIFNAIVRKSGTREIMLAQDVFKDFTIVATIHDEMRVSLDSKNWDWKISATRENLEEDFLKMMGQDRYDAMMAIKEKDEISEGVPKNEFADVFQLKEGKKNKL